MFARVTKAILLVGAIATSTAAAATEEWQVKASPYSVPETVARLSAALEGAGAEIAAVLDHSDAAGSDTDPAPTTVVIFADPKPATPSMQDDRTTGMGLPVRILVWQEGDATMVGYVEPTPLATHHEIADDERSIAMIEGALGVLPNPETYL